MTRPEGAIRRALKSGNEVSYNPAEQSVVVDPVVIHAGLNEKGEIA